jgi:fluoroquinolone transport system permease protein
VGAAAALLWRDLRILQRDAVLVFLFLYPVAMALVGRMVFPIIPLPDVYLYLGPSILVACPFAAGMVYGFILIGEKEQKTWYALRVLPFPERRHYTYLTVLTVATSVVLSVAAAMAYGRPVVDRIGFGIMVLANSLSAPVVALFIGTFASNKVEGFAIMKTIGAFMFAPAIVFVATPMWHATVAWCPWYWAYVGLLRAYVGHVSEATRYARLPPLPFDVVALASSALSLVYGLWLVRRWRSGVT